MKYSSAGTYDIPGTSKKNTEGNIARSHPLARFPDGQPRVLKRLTVEDGLPATLFGRLASPVPSDASVEGVLPKPKTQGQSEILENA